MPVGASRPRCLSGGASKRRQAQPGEMLIQLDDPSLVAGDVAIFDYRLLHRGRANRSGKMRPVLYLTYGTLTSAGVFFMAFAGALALDLL
eukprot:scaffold5438_cov237-Pinguiococcus_pyrenoidosus.AAC.8